MASRPLASIITSLAVLVGDASYRCQTYARAERARILRILTAFLFLLSLPLPPVSANDFPTAAPEQHGFNSERLRNLSGHFQSRVDEGELAGIVVLISRNGEIIHFDALGYQDALNEIPMETDTVFRIYSMTKPIASTALMMLYQEGKFQLTDPLSKYIPEFEGLTVLRDPEAGLTDVVALRSEPTIQDALRHTSGFSHGLGTSAYDQAFVASGIFRPDTSLEEMMTLLSGLPLMNQPGEQWRYGVGHDIALRLVEIMSGMPADEYLEARLFQPLGMDDTAYWIGPSDQHRLGPVHYLSETGGLLPISEHHGAPEGGVLVQPWSVNSYGFDQEFKGGSFGLLSTAEDYWRFGQAILNAGELDGERILAPSITRLMTRNHLAGEQQFLDGAGMGLGFGIVQDPAQFGFPYSEGTLFWGGAASTAFWIDPEEQLVVVAMSQHMGVPNTDLLRGELASLVYAALEQ